MKCEKVESCAARSICSCRYYQPRRMSLCKRIKWRATGWSGEWILGKNELEGTAEQFGSAARTVTFLDMSENWGRVSRLGSAAPTLLLCSDACQSSPLCCVHAMSDIVSGPTPHDHRFSTTDRPIAGQQGPSIS